MDDQANVAGDTPFADAIVKLAQNKGQMKDPAENKTEESKPELESVNETDLQSSNKEQTKSEEKTYEVKSEEKESPD